MAKSSKNLPVGIADAHHHLAVPGRDDPASGGWALSQCDTEATPGFAGDKDDAEPILAALGAEIAELQAKLAADGYTGGSKRVLLVVQGMDTSGKGGVLKDVIGMLDPGGVRIKSFKKPTEEELAHDFLWRVEPELPGPGQIGIFDRSHYEDVLVVKVHGYAAPQEIERRYEAINDWEASVTDRGTTLIKVMLHISAETQKERLLARLADPTKQWKFKPGDIDERAHWDTYQQVYDEALRRCSTTQAPWYVIPADRKWYRSLAIATLLRDALVAMNLTWPVLDFDIDEQRARLAD